MRGRKESETEVWRHHGNQLRFLSVPRADRLPLITQVQILERTELQRASNHQLNVQRSAPRGQGDVGGLSGGRWGTSGDSSPLRPRPDVHHRGASQAAQR